ncbi:MAG: hypothetical protein ACOYOB_18720 [Myxococcota bacterium]
MDITIGEPFRWLDLVIPLDGSAGSATSYTLPRELSLFVGSANQATFAVDVAAIGPGATTTTLKLQRSQSGDPAADEFEDTGVSQLLTRMRSYYTFSLGRDGTGFASPRGCIRVVLTNTGSASAYALVHLRVWVTLQDYGSAQVAARSPASARATVLGQVNATATSGFPASNGGGCGASRPAATPNLAPSHGALQYSARPESAEGSSLWFEGVVPLDENTAGYASRWELPIQRALRFGNARRFVSTVEYIGIGPGAPNTTITFQRSSNPTEQLIGTSAAWEDMMPTPAALARAPGTITLTFGEDGPPLYKYPRGLGRFLLANSSAASSGGWSIIWMRAWARLA